ncbi:MAG: hypothetical protein WAS72_13505 [Saprospiraceae bacterium]
MKRIIYFFILTFLFAFVACKNSSSNKTTTTSNSDFAIFYEKFHQDSVFQVAHILFPLEGLPNQADSATLENEKYFWEQKDWVLHKPFTEDNKEYERNLTQITDGMVVETIRFANGEYGIQRRFARFGKDWFLIYYAGMNRIIQPKVTPPVKED